jgi:hypothetical protein
MTISVNYTAVADKQELLVQRLARAGAKQALEVRASKNWVLIRDTAANLVLAEARVADEDSLPATQALVEECMLGQGPSPQVLEKAKAWAGHHPNFRMNQY